MKKAAGEPIEAAAAPSPETEKERLRREEDTLEAVLELVSASDAGTVVPAILAASGLPDLALQQALDQLTAQGRVSPVVQLGTLAYRRIS